MNKEKKGDLISFSFRMVVPARIELATHGFSVRCSTY